MKIVYWEGEFLPADQAMVPVEDPGFLYGEGFFTTARIAKGRVEHWSLHLRRLNHSSAQMEIALPSIDEKIFDQLIERNCIVEGRLKVLVTGGGRLLIEVRPYEMVDRQWRLAIYPNLIESSLSQFKSLAYVPRFHVQRWAKSQGFDDALTVNHKRFLLEASHSNFFWEVDGAFYTPDPHRLPLVYGIGLQSFFGDEIHFVCAQVEEIPDGAHLYLINSLSGPQPVVELQGRSFDPKPLCRSPHQSK